MNGYFQLLINEQGTNLCIFSPTEGGNSIDINELAAYLQKKNVIYDLQAVNNALKSENEKVVINLMASSIYAEQEMFVIKKSPDLMLAVARFYPPSNGGAVMNKAEIINDLFHQGVVFGVDEDAIDEFVKNKQYCTDIIVAKGLPPVHGRDASIEYFFNTDLRARPTLNADGSVDFYHLNTMNHCKQGDIIARLYKEDLGEPGKNIEGAVIKPRDVKTMKLQYGRNITISEDKTVLITDVSGHVSLVEGKVFVADVYQVENVDNSTGNIEYEGSVLVTGNVCSNFKVKASGNIEVRGVVEGAIVEAGGNIIIARGVNGMGKGILKAEGNVISKFIENATVVSGGFVETEAILLSKVMAKTDVNVTGGKGFITGGVVCATNSVCVKTLGSNMGADTVVEIGVNPTMKLRYQQLQKDIIENQKTLKTIQPVLEATTKRIEQGIKMTPDQIKHIQSLAIASKQKKEQLQKDNLELQDIQLLLESNANAHVNVTGEVYSGTKIIISDVSMIVKTSMKYCKFIRSQGEVKMTAL